MLSKVTGKSAKAGTHAHYAGEFGSQKMTKSLEKDPAYRAARAQHFANEAHAAVAAHANATSHADKASHALVAAHAMKMAEKHAKAAAKLAPGSEHAAAGKAAHESAKSAHDAIKNGAAAPKNTPSAPMAAPDKPLKIPRNLQKYVKPDPSTTESADKPKSKKELEKDPKWRVERAEHFAHVAADAALKHSTATGSMKAQHALEITHALKRAEAHKNAVYKLTKGDYSEASTDLRYRAATAHTATQNIHSQITKPKSPKLGELLAGHKTSGFQVKANPKSPKLAAPKPSGFQVKKLAAPKTSGLTQAKADFSTAWALAAHKADAHAIDAKKLIDPSSVHGVDSSKLYPHHEFLNHRQEFEKNLTFGEKSAALHYSGNGYKDMNHALRKDKDLEAHGVAKYVAQLDSVIAKSSLHKEVIVFRGPGSDGATYDHYYGLMINGATHYTEKGYSSTSVTEPFGGRVKIHITVPAGRQGAPIPSKSPNENEILLPRNQRFRIDKFEQTTDKWGESKLHVHVTAVDPE